MISFRRCAATICAVGLGAAVSASPALADDVDLGAAAPDAVTGIAWDEGSGEVLVADAAGAITARDPAAGTDRQVTFTGAPESVQALGLFGGMLYIGDVGDEDANREFVSVFRVDPQPGSTNYRAWDFSYPDGARDARAMAVSGKGRIYIVTAGEDPGIYRAGLEPSRSGVNTLVRAADAPEGVTDAVFLNDGSTLMLRTSDGVDLVDAYTWEVQASTTYVGGPQGESITVFTPERMLVGGGAVLRDEPLPSGMTTATPVPSVEASAPVSTPGTAAPEPTGEAPSEGDPEESQTSEVSRSGTMIALLGAGAVAVLAGVFVFVARD